MNQRPLARAHGGRAPARCVAALACLVLGACDLQEQPAGPWTVPAQLDIYQDAISAPMNPSLDAAAFQPASACAGCHPQHYEQWQHSAHAQAMRDPVFQALVQRQRQDTETGLDRFCTQCHSAIGTRAGLLPQGFDFAALEGVVGEGVTCSNCHQAVAVARPNNAGHVLDPHAPTQGPFGSDAASHPVERSELLVTADLCGACHDVDAGGLPLESPFQEWLRAPAADEGRPCQHCHMPTYKGRAASLADAPRRPTLHRHDFVGADVPLSVPAGALRDALHEASARLLRSSLDLELVAPRRLVMGERSLRFEASVESLVDGHNVPTGSSFFRQCWLEVTVRDARGAVLFRSGHLDAHGDLYDELHPEAARDPYLSLFNATLRDEHGDATLWPWRAKRREDRTLAPLERRVVPYSVELPTGTRPPLRIEARLRFRGLPPRLLRHLDLQPLLPLLEIVEIDRAEAVVTRAPGED